MRGVPHGPAWEAAVIVYPALPLRRAWSAPTGTSTISASAGWTAIPLGRER